MTAPPASAALAYHGAPGAFGEAACVAHDPAAIAVPHSTAEAALGAVRAGRCAAALLPIHNSVGGPVAGNVALIAGAGLATIGEVALPITMALIAPPGATIAAITGITSHPMALRQCSRLIARLGVVTRVADTTAAAAAEIARAGDPRRAALAAARVAARHGLVVLADDVGDDPGAVTRFAVLTLPGAQ